MSSTMQTLIAKVGKGEKGAKDLTHDEAKEAMRLLLEGVATPAQVGSFLVAMRIKSESVSELAAFTATAREYAPPLPMPPELGLVDIPTYAGKQDSWHVLLPAAIVAAAAVVPVLFFFSSRRRHTRCSRDWSSDVCSSDLDLEVERELHHARQLTGRRPRRDAQQQAVDRHGLPGRIAAVPLYLEAVADRAEVERPERGAVLVQQRHVHRLERARHEPCPERPVLDGDLRIARHHDGHGFRPQPHGLEHAGHLGRKYELVGAIPRIEHYEAPEHRDGGVPPPAKQLGGPQIDQTLSAPRDWRVGGGQLHDAPAQQQRGHIELEVLVCAHPRDDETVR